MTAAVNRQARIAVMALMFIALIIGLGWLGVETVENKLKENLSQQLHAALKSSKEAFRLWTHDTRIDAQILTNEPSTRSHLLKLLEFSESANVSLKDLRSNPDLQWLRKYLGRACAKYGFVGFVVFDAKGLQVGALLDEPMGKSNLKKRSGFFHRSILGETVISHPFPAEISIPDLEGESPLEQTTMLVSTPIFNNLSEIVGVLAFRIRPETEFSRFMSAGRFGKTGETYLIDQNGILLSPSRFDESLREIGLLGRNQSSHLNIQIKDPGRDLTQAPITSADKTDQWPLNQMAKALISKNKGENLEGYRDYRGTPVVGVWAWLEEHQLGMATEMSVEEAFAPINTLTNWFLGMASLLLIASIVAWILVMRNEATRQEGRTHAARLDSIMNSLRDPIIAIDENGTILTVSPAVKKQFYYKPEELIGKNVKILVPEPHQSKHDEYIQNYLKTGHAKIINMMRILDGLRKDGSTFPMELRVTEMVSKGKSYFTGIIRDITELKRSEEKLREANLFLEKRIEQRTKELEKTTREAEKSNAAKSEFLTRMSHELRTPMNAILGFSQLVYSSKTEPLSENQKLRLDQIIKAGRHLLELINEVLDLATIESGRISISPEPVCLADLMDEIYAVTQPIAEQYGITLINEVGGNGSIYVLADKIRLKQVLLNLISNGIKYNRSGGTVTINTTEKDRQTQCVEVTDTGMGIPPEKLNKVFEPFDRLGVENNEIEGTGIGMAISRKLMKLMQGTLGVDSIVGQGSRFFITLPKSARPRNFAALQEKPARGPASEQDRERSQRTLLYIEDNPANLKLVEEILHERPSINLLSAHHPHLGMELARTHKPDLILLDINLPDLDGYKVLKHLQNYDETHTIPVIAISANAMAKDIKRALDCGFSAYLTKPIDLSQFLSVIDKYIESRPEKTPPAPKAKPVSPASGDPEAAAGQDQANT